MLFLGTHISSVHVTALFFFHCKLINSILALRRKKGVGRKEKEVSLAEKRESSQRRKSRIKGGIFFFFLKDGNSVCNYLSYFSAVLSRELEKADHWIQS